MLNEKEIINDRVGQLVDRGIEDPGVGGSSPSPVTNKKSFLIFIKIYVIIYMLNEKSIKYACLAQSVEQLAVSD